MEAGRFCAACALMNEDSEGRIKHGGSVNAVLVNSVSGRAVCRLRVASRY